MFITIGQHLCICKMWEKPSFLAKIMLNIILIETPSYDLAVAQIHTLIDCKLYKELGSGYSAPKQIILYQSQNRVLLLRTSIPMFRLIPALSQQGWQPGTKISWQFSRSLWKRRICRFLQGSLLYFVLVNEISRI